MSLFTQRSLITPLFSFLFFLGGVLSFFLSFFLFGLQVFARVDAAGALGLDALLLSEEFGGSERKRSFISSIFPWRCYVG